MAELSAELHSERPEWWVHHAVIAAAVSGDWYVGMTNTARHLVRVHIPTGAVHFDDITTAGHPNAQVWSNPAVVAPNGNVCAFGSLHTFNQANSTVHVLEIVPSTGAIAAHYSQTLTLGGGRWTARNNVAVSGGVAYLAGMLGAFMTVVDLGARTIDYGPPLPSLGTTIGSAPAYYGLRSFLDPGNPDIAWVFQEGQLPIRVDLSAGTSATVGSTTLTRVPDYLIGGEFWGLGQTASTVVDPATQGVTNSGPGIGGAGQPGETAVAQLSDGRIVWFASTLGGSTDPVHERLFPAGPVQTASIRDSSAAGVCVPANDDKTVWLWRDALYKITPSSRRRHGRLYGLGRGTRSVH